MIDTSELYLDFNINGCTTNCKLLEVVDASNWGAMALNASYMDITPPGATIPISNFFQKYQVNHFNTNSLNLSDVTDYSRLGDLPDGIYQVCLRVCAGEDTSTNPATPIFETSCKYWLQDCHLRCAIDRKLLSIDLTCQPCRVELIRELEDIELFLQAAHAQINQCNVNKASEYFQKAKQLLGRLSAPDLKHPCRNCNGVGGFPN